MIKSKEERNKYSERLAKSNKQSKMKRLKDLSNEKNKNKEEKKIKKNLIKKMISNSIKDCNINCISNEKVENLSDHLLCIAEFQI